MLYVCQSGWCWKIHHTLLSENNLKLLNANSAAKCCCYLWEIQWEEKLTFSCAVTVFLLSNYNIWACRTHICDAKLSFSYVSSFSEDELACLPMWKICLLLCFYYFRMPKKCDFPFVKGIPGYGCCFLILLDLVL